jgi:hypothetical protein
MTLPDAMELARLNGELGLALTEALVEIDRLRQIDRLRLAATPAPLDVERLALALHNTGLNSIGHKPGFHGRYSDRCICHPDAAQIASEYAAITPKDFSTRIYKENRGE